MPESRLWRVLAALALAPVVGLLLAALAPTGWWIPRLALHWAPHLAVLALPAWCWLGRRSWPGLVIAGLYASALWPWVIAAHAPRAPLPVATAAGTAAAAAATPAALRAAVANVWLWNPDPVAALAVVDADLVALIECDYGRCAPIRRDPRWPHQLWNAASGFDGMALLSRFPIRSQRIRFIERAPAIEAVIATPRGDLRVIAAHLWSPKRPAHDRLHQQQAAAIADLIRQHAGPILFLGDCNSSPASSTLRILAQAGLLPAHGRTPATWPSHLGPAGIAIDRILTRNLSISQVVAQNLPGSDHRWVYATCPSQLAD